MHLSNQNRILHLTQIKKTERIIVENFAYTVCALNWSAATGLFGLI